MSNETKNAVSLAKGWVIAEVRDKDLLSVTLCNSEADAISKANERLEAHIREIGRDNELMEIRERLKDAPDADIGSNEFQFVRPGRLLAWCSIDCYWGAFIFSILTVGTVEGILDRLLTKSEEHLIGPVDTYNQGYHDALMDVLKELRSNK